MMKKNIPEGYKELPEKARAALRELADKFFRPTESSLQPDSSKKSAPEGYTPVTEMLNEAQKAEIDSADKKTEESFKTFSAY